MSETLPWGISKFALRCPKCRKTIRTVHIRLTRDRNANAVHQFYVVDLFSDADPYAASFACTRANCNFSATYDRDYLRALIWRSISNGTHHASLGAPAPRDVPGMHTSREW
jgi:hypothetical protein